jgi:hypothetical protein
MDGATQLGASAGVGTSPSTAALPTPAPVVVPSAAPAASPTAAAPIDYDVLAQQARGGAAPSTARAGNIDYDALAQQARTAQATSPQQQVDPIRQSLTANPKGEGIYQMKNGAGGSLAVPFSNVEAMPDFRNNFDNEQEAERYLKDKSAVTPGFIHSTFNAITKPIQNYADQKLAQYTSPLTPERRQQLAQNGFKTGDLRAADFMQGTLNGIGEMLNHPIQTVSGTVDSLDNLADYIQQKLVPTGLWSPAEQKDVPKGAAAFTQMIQKMEQQYKNKPPYFLGQMLGQAILAHGAGEAFTPVAGAIKAAPEYTSAAANTMAKELTGVRPHIAQQMVEDTMDTNQAAQQTAAAENVTNAQQHSEQVQSALQDTQQAEDLHANAQRTAQSDQQAAHQQQVSDINDKNQLVQDQHAAKAQRIQANNDTLQQQITQRQGLEQQYSDATDQYYQKEGEVRTAAKATENQAWAPWHAAMDDVPVDSDRIMQPLQKIFKNSPEAKRALAQLQPDPEDVGEQAANDPQVQHYLQGRQQVMQQLFPKGAQDYEGLSPMQQDQVNSIMRSGGMEPPALDFDPEDGGQMTVGQIQRAKSILGQKLMKNQYEGYIKGEMQKVYNVLDNTVKAASDENDMGDTYSAAKQATQKFNQAFGRERPRIMTQDELRMKQANPQAYAQRLQDEKLAAVSYHDPELADSYRNVQQMRQQLSDTPEVEQLQKKIKPVPAPPSVGDIRPGMALQEHPPAPEPVQLPQPNRAPVPNRPEEVQPEVTQVGTDDLMQKNRDTYTQAVRSLRNRGIWYGAALPWLWVVRDVMHGNIEGAAGSAVGAAVSSVGSIVGLTKLSDWMEKPEVRDWVARPNERQMQEFNKLPPEQRKVIASGFDNMWKVAKMKSIAGKPFKISPLLLGFIAANRPKSGAELDAIKQKALTEMGQAGVSSEPDPAEGVGAAASPADIIGTGQPSATAGAPPQ